MGRWFRLPKNAAADPAATIPRIGVALVPAPPGRIWTRKKGNDCTHRPTEVRLCRENNGLRPGGTFRNLGRTCARSELGRQFGGILGATIGDGANAIWMQV